MAASVFLGLALYRITKSFPESERFALRAQLRRGAVAVASNIAEGYGRGGQGDYLRFLKIARGAPYEIETQVSFAGDFGYIENDAAHEINTQTEECGRVLGGLIRANELP